MMPMIIGISRWNAEEYTIVMLAVVCSINMRELSAPNFERTFDDQGVMHLATRYHPVLR